jgi:hypothetical protein
LNTLKGFGSDSLSASRTPVVLTPVTGSYDERKERKGFQNLDEFLDDDDDEEEEEEQSEDEEDEEEGDEEEEEGEETDDQKSHNGKHDRNPQSAG